MVSNSWGGVEGSAEVWVREYHEFLQTETALISIPHFHQELQRYLEEEENDYEQPQQREYHDDWMQLCQLHPRFEIPLESDNTVDWEEAARQLTPGNLRDSPSWISSQRRLADSTSHSPWIRHLPQVDISTLSHKQQHVYDIVMTHHTSDSPPPLRMIVSGTAGTGKSYLISALSQLLGDSCMLTGTTGMASFNICGMTLHSTLQLPVQRSNHANLQGTSLQQLQVKLIEKHYLIIDEMSMIGQRMMAWVDKRL